MKLSGRFVVTIEGVAYRVRRRSVIVPNALPHLLAYLLDGNEMTHEPFEAFGLRVTVEECTDGGDGDAMAGDAELSMTSAITTDD